MKKLWKCMILAIPATIVINITQAQQKFKITGNYSSQYDVECNCNQGLMQGLVSYYYNGSKVTLNVCMPMAQMMEGSEITLEVEYQSGKCTANKLLGQGDFVANPPLFTGTFKKENYKCPIANEGIIQTTDGKKYSITTSKAIPDNASIRVTQAAWGVKYCDGKYYQVYHILNYESGNSAVKTYTYSGNFRSVKGVRDQASTVGYNIGYFESTATKGGASESFLVCFDKLPNGNDLEVGNYISVDGYFETVKGYKVFYVTKYYN